MKCSDAIRRNLVDHCSKHRKVDYKPRGGTDGHFTFSAWQDKQIIYLSSKGVEVARLLSWVSI